MNSTQRRPMRIGAMFLLAFSCVALTGCRKPVDKGSPAEESRLKRLVIFYIQFAGEHGGRAPTPPELKQFVAARLTSYQKAAATAKEEAASKEPSAPDAKPETAEDLFVSPRDNQPYVFAPIKVLRGIPPTHPAVVLYEKEGVDGKRWIALSHGGIQEVDQKKFKQLVSK